MKELKVNDASEGDNRKVHNVYSHKKPKFGK